MFGLSVSIAVGDFYFGSNSSDEVRQECLETRNISLSTFGHNTTGECSLENYCMNLRSYLYINGIGLIVFAIVGLTFEYCWQSGISLILSIVTLVFVVSWTIVGVYFIDKMPLDECPLELERFIDVSTAIDLVVVPSIFSLSAFICRKSKSEYEEFASNSRYW